MTNAIEQARREMYKALAIVNECFSSLPTQKFETALESYLELLRQDHEALHETARKRFDDLQAAEAVNQELQEKNQYWRDLNANQRNTIEGMQDRLAKMTEERDSIQLRLHAADHAYKAQQERSATPTHDSGYRASCEATDGQKTAIQGALADIRKVADAWALTGRRAKKSMLKISGILDRPEVYAAMEAIGAPTTCMHSFFAIGQDQMKCTFCGVGK